MSLIERHDIYKTVHKALRCALFQLSSRIAKFDPSIDDNLDEIAHEFEELSSFLKDHGSHEDRFFHVFLEKKHPNVFDSLQRQHEHSEIDWRAVEEDARRLFENGQRPDSHDWQRFYLRFNNFVVSYLTHLQYEELVALPLIWEVATNEDLMKGLMEMFKTFTPEHKARSKKWCMLSCNLSELKAMGYVP